MDEGGFPHTSHQSDLLHTGHVQVSVTTKWDLRLHPDSFNFVPVYFNSFGMSVWCVVSLDRQASCIVRIASVI